MKNHLSFFCFLFVIVILLLLYMPFRVWLIRQVSFSPTLEKVTSGKAIFNYDCELKGTNTTDVNFDAFKGKVIFLNYWATWCPPCVAELPYIQSFYNDYKDKVAFVFISKEKETVINSFFSEKGYDFPVYQYKSTTIKDLPEISSIPRTFIIDKNGNIRVDKSGAADWNSKSFRKQIDDLLK